MLIKVSPDFEKARSILKMAENTLSLVQGLDATKFPSQITKEYYNVMRELISVIALLDGYKTQGEGAHKELIEYLHTYYKEKFTEHSLSLLEELRVIRNRIEYDGFFVNKEYVKRNQKYFEMIIEKLREMVGRKLL